MRDEIVVPLANCSDDGTNRFESLSPDVRLGKRRCGVRRRCLEEAVALVLFTAKRAPMDVDIGSEGSCAVLALGRTESALNGPPRGQGRRPADEVAVTAVEYA